MKVIDLLNKIAKGEDVPKKIKYFGHIYELKERNESYYNYKDNEGDYFEDNYFLSNILNDEVEIIEDTPKKDKKIKKLSEHIFVDGHSMVLKINEIIDKINGDSNE